MAVPPRRTLLRAPAFLLALAIPTTRVAAQAPDDSSAVAQRLAMVALVEARGVADSATLAAMRRVPRHLFVPPERRDSAYADRPLRIGYGATITQPYIVALMTAAVAPRPGMRMLEIGTGSGYQAAVLATIGCEVFSIEIVDSLASAAAERLRRLGFTRVHVRQGDGWLGWPEAAPFDGIVVTAAPDSIPGALVAQLAPFGRMVVPVGPQGVNQRLVLVEKDAAGRVTSRDLRMVTFVPMVR